MIKLSASDLGKKSVVFRYLYYVLSSLKLKSFRSWQKDGEPNPFVGNCYKRVVTEQIEFVDIFEDDLRQERSSPSRD